jgi:hypothetical protein
MFSKLESASVITLLLGPASRLVHFSYVSMKQALSRAHSFKFMVEPVVANSSAITK